MKKTYSPKLSEIERKWYLVDAKGKILGDLASKLAVILRGKNKTMFSPHLDCGDYVVVINAKEVGLTGKKLTDKLYHHHTRYGNGLRTYSARELLERKPEEVLFHAVAGMLKQSKIKKDILKKLKIYPGAEHEQTAQQPAPLEI